VGRLPPSFRSGSRRFVQIYDGTESVAIAKDGTWDRFYIGNRTTVALRRAAQHSTQASIISRPSHGAASRRPWGVWELERLATALPQSDSQGRLTKNVKGLNICGPTPSRRCDRCRSNDQRMAQSQRVRAAGSRWRPGPPANVAGSPDFHVLTDPVTDHGKKPSRSGFGRSVGCCYLASSCVRFRRWGQGNLDKGSRELVTAAARSACRHPLH
jgi:hypothetical protein